MAKERQIKQVLEYLFPNKFFEVALNTFDSNFIQWRTDNLQRTMGGNHLPAQALDGSHATGKRTDPLFKSENKHPKRQYSAGCMRN
jgi:hypothetical protein